VTKRKKSGSPNRKEAQKEVPTAKPEEKESEPSYKEGEERNQKKVKGRRRFAQRLVVGGLKPGRGETKKVKKGELRGRLGRKRHKKEKLPGAEERKGCAPEGERRETGKGRNPCC